jgi:hypothetical protein
MQGISYFPFSEELKLLHGGLIYKHGQNIFLNLICCAVMNMKSSFVYF